MQPVTQLGGEPREMTINQQTASHASLAIPRLISVAEIIKREYVNILRESRSSRLHGLYQYNQIGTLEQLGVTVNPGTADSSNASPAELRKIQIIEALKGQNQ